MLEHLRQDVVYAFRNLRKSPGYAAVTVLTLALGIGANTAIFSVVNGVVLKPLPYPKPGRLVIITSQFPGLGFDQFWVSAPEFIEFRDRNQSFAQVGAYSAGAVNLGTADQPRRVEFGAGHLRADAGARSLAAARTHLHKSGHASRRGRRRRYLERDLAVVVRRRRVGRRTGHPD